ncbi:MAG: hypothetical protein H7240_07165 [Glaciimonas sp.]|nr:hypothetical protein [Glaciimonas sp.]
MQNYFLLLYRIHYLNFNLEGAEELISELTALMALAEKAYDANAQTIASLEVARKVSV